MGSGNARGARAVEVEREHDRDSPPSAPQKVLIVEDNPGDIELLEDRISRHARGVFAVHSATSLEAARCSLAQRPAELIILDLNLPDSSGLDTLRQVKSFSGDAAVVVISGAADELIRDRAIALGADEVFGKDESSTRVFARSMDYFLERNRAREEHGELERLLSTTPDAILVVDDGGRVQYVNQAALDLFARRREDFEEELMVFSIGSGQATEITILRGRERRVCEMRMADIEWRKRRAHLASIRDITAQREMEAQLAVSDRMVSVGTLAAGVAHEVNNPLAALMANLYLAVEGVESLLQGRGASPELDELLEELRDASEGADRIRNIVKDLKLFSRVEEETTGPVDIHRVLESTLRMARNEVRHRARLIKRYGDVPMVQASESRLGQVFLNIVMNAAQSIVEGRMNANEIVVSTQVDDAAQVVIEISDTGAGMPDHVLEKLFTPFFTTKPVGMGTGLGLSICQRIVNGFGGEITVSSQVGLGTTFRVTLPASPTVESAVDSGAELVGRAARGKILVVDDEVSVSTAVRRTLASEHDVVAVNEAATAVRLVEGGELFEIILCDLLMPQMTGMELHAILTEVDPRQAANIIFMTGGAFTQGARAFLERITNLVVEKPFEPKALRAVVNEHLRARAARGDD